MGMGLCIEYLQRTLMCHIIQMIKISAFVSRLDQTKD